MQHSSFNPQAAQLFKYAGYAFIAVILLSIIMQYFMPITLPGMPTGFVTPVMAFEYVSSMTEAQALFGDDTNLLVGMLKGIWVDMLYAVVYGSFLVLASVAAWRQTGNKYLLSGAILAVFGSTFDFLENNQLIGVGNALLNQIPYTQFELLNALVTGKFVCLSLAGLSLAPFLNLLGKRGKTFIGLSFLGLCSALIAVYEKAYFAEITLMCLVVAWTLLAIIGFRYPVYFKPKTQ